MTSQKRRLLLKLRRTVSIATRQTAIGTQGKTVTYRCERCGTISTKDLPSEFGAKLMARWHGQANGSATGVCKVCTKRARDEKYPLS